MQWRYNDFRAASQVYEDGRDSDTIVLLDKILGLEQAAKYEQRLLSLKRWVTKPNVERFVTEPIDNPTLDTLGVIALLELMTLRSKCFSSILYGDLPNKLDWLDSAVENTNFAIHTARTADQAGLFSGLYHSKWLDLWAVAAQPVLISRDLIEVGLNMLLFVIQNEPNEDHKRVIRYLANHVLPEVVPGLPPGHVARAKSQKLMSLVHVRP